MPYQDSTLAGAHKGFESGIYIDEAWCYMSRVNGCRKIYHQFRAKESPQSFRKYWRQKRLQGIMFIAAINCKGTTTIRFIPPRTKVDSHFYINKVLRPLFKKDIPRLFGRRAKMAVLRHDTANLPHLSPMKEEWKYISRKLCVKTMTSWKGRAREMLNKNGYQKEHLRNFRKKIVLEKNGNKLIGWTLLADPL
jgi:hypothetical protein